MQATTKNGNELVTKYNKYPTGYNHNRNHNYNQHNHNHHSTSTTTTTTTKPQLLQVFCCSGPKRGLLPCARLGAASAAWAWGYPLDWCPAFSRQAQRPRGSALLQNLPNRIQYAPLETTTTTNNNHTTTQPHNHDSNNYYTTTTTATANATTTTATTT